jgi:hypothetical protein
MLLITSKLTGYKHRLFSIDVGDAKEPNSTPTSAPIILLLYLCHRSPDSLIMSASRTVDLFLALDLRRYAVRETPRGHVGI